MLDKGAPSTWPAAQTKVDKVDTKVRGGGPEAKMSSGVNAADGPNDGARDGSDSSCIASTEGARTESCETQADGADDYDDEDTLDDSNVEDDGMTHIHLTKVTPPGGNDTASSAQLAEEVAVSSGGRGVGISGEADCACVCAPSQDFRENLQRMVSARSMGASEAAWSTERAEAIGTSPGSSRYAEFGTGQPMNLMNRLWHPRSKAQKLRLSCQAYMSNCSAVGGIMLVMMHEGLLRKARSAGHYSRLRCCRRLPRQVAIAAH